MQTACLHPKGVEQAARFRPTRLLRIPEECVSDVWSYGRKKVNPPVGLGLGHLKLNGMEFLKGIGLQIYQYEEHFVLNQRQHTGLPVVRYMLAHFAFQGKLAVIFIPMVLESY